MSLVQLREVMGSCDHANCLRFIPPRCSWRHINTKAQRLLATVGVREVTGGQQPRIGLGVRLFSRTHTVESQLREIAAICAQVLRPENAQELSVSNHGSCVVGLLRLWVMWVSVSWEFLHFSSSCAPDSFWRRLRRHVQATASVSTQVSLSVLRDSFKAARGRRFSDMQLDMSATMHGVVRQRGTRILARNMSMPTITTLRRRRAMGVEALFMSPLEYAHFVLPVVLSYLRTNYLYDTGVPCGLSVDATKLLPELQTYKRGGTNYVLGQPFSINEPPARAVETLDEVRDVRDTEVATDLLQIVFSTYSSPSMFLSFPLCALALTRVSWTDMFSTWESLMELMEENSIRLVQVVGSDNAGENRQLHRVACRASELLMKESTSDGFSRWARRILQRPLVSGSGIITMGQGLAVIDPEHTVRNLKNQMALSRVLLLGALPVSFSFVVQAGGAAGLRRSTLELRDKQSQQAAEDVFREEVWRAVQELFAGQATATYLRACTLFMVGLLARNISPLERVRSVFACILFLRAWRVSLAVDRLTVNHFISSQTFDAVCSGGSALLSYITMLSTEFAGLMPCAFWRLGSACCERLFARQRAATSNGELTVRSYLSEGSKILQSSLLSKGAGTPEAALSIAVPIAKKRRGRMLKDGRQNGEPRGCPKSPSDIVLALAEAERCAVDLCEAAGILEVLVHCGAADHIRRRFVDQEFLRIESGARSNHMDRPMVNEGRRLTEKILSQLRSSKERVCVRASRLRKLAERRRAMEYSAREIRPPEAIVAAAERQLEDERTAQCGDEVGAALRKLVAERAIDTGAAKGVGRTLRVRRRASNPRGWVNASRRVAVGEFWEIDPPDLLGSCSCVLVCEMTHQKVHDDESQRRLPRSAVLEGGSAVWGLPLQAVNRTSKGMEFIVQPWLQLWRDTCRASALIHETAGAGGKVPAWFSVEILKRRLRVLQSGPKSVFLEVAESENEGARKRRRTTAGPPFHENVVH